jgi:hypothetical protein
MQFLEATAFEIMADDGDARWIRARELTEASDGEEHVLVRVECRVLDGHSREQVRRREKTRRAREAQVRFALGRRAVRRCVTPIETWEMSCRDCHGGYLERTYPLKMRRARGSSVAIWELFGGLRMRKAG